MVMRWLITGGCGFIGTNLIKYLLKEKPGDKIGVLDNLSVGTREDLARVCMFSEKGEAGSEKSFSLLTPDSSLNSQCELIVGDIVDFETCLACCKGVDIVVHLAANTGVGPSVENPRKDMEANVIGTFNMLEAARVNAAKRFIFASSGAPVGECEPPIHEEKVPHPVSPYGASKLAGEGYCSVYYRTFGVETVALRFGNVYGPGSGHKSSVVAKFIKHVLAGEPLEVYGDGNQTRDFIYIDDMVDALRKAASVGGIGGEVFQIATSRETTINELLQFMAEIFKKHSLALTPVAYCNERLGDVKRNFSDTLKAATKLDWKVKTSLKDGLDETLAWFLSKD